MYQNIDLPPGIRSNGTDYQSRGAWLAGDRIRWNKGLIQPIGGWNKFISGVGELDQVLTSPATQISRAVYSWRDNAGASYYVVGHNDGLAAFSRASNTVYDITPAGFTARDAGLESDTGYGDWFYGADSYGTLRPTEDEDASIFNWCFRNWGEGLLASERTSPSKLYEWDLTLADAATQVANSPTNFDCFHVTEQRIVLVAGSETEPRLVTWCDSEDNTEWSPAVTNQAGFQTLSGIGRFKEIVDFRSQLLLISENDAHLGRYLGPPYVLGFDKVGDDCGVASGAAVAATEDFVVWPGSRNFFLYDGSLRTLDCTVIDELESAMSSINWQKTVSFVNADWSEVWWLFQSFDSATEELDSYVAWDYSTDHWITGTLDRTSGTGNGPSPLLMGSDGYLYTHEVAGVIPTDTNNAAMFLESGPIELKGGNTTQYIDSFQPDMLAEGSADFYFIGRDRPGGPETTFGPYLVSYPSDTNQPVACRVRGHTVRMKVVGNTSLWSMGSTRLNFKNSGGKK